MSSPYREPGERHDDRGPRWGATRWARFKLRAMRVVFALVGERDEQRFAADARAYRLKMAAWRDETGLKLLDVEAIVERLEEDDYPPLPHLPRLPRLRRLRPPAVPPMRLVPPRKVRE